MKKWLRKRILHWLGLGYIDPWGEKYEVSYGRLHVIGEQLGRIEDRLRRLEEKKSDQEHVAQ